MCVIRSTSIQEMLMEPSDSDAAFSLMVAHFYLKAVANCGGNVYIPSNSTQTHTLRTPNYPTRNYPNNALCEWNFVLEFPTPVGYRGSGALSDVSLSISFPRCIDVQYSPSCSKDKVEVWLYFTFTILNNIKGLDISYNQTPHV